MIKKGGETIFCDFRKTFNPTPEEVAEQEIYLQKLIDEDREFWLNKGLTLKEIELLHEMEVSETQHLRSFQTYVSRSSLISSGIISLESVKNDISKYQKLKKG